jgi:hypothetical protein
MKFARAEKRLWVFASVCGILGTGLVVALFRVPRSPLPKEIATPTPKNAGSETVGLARIDDRDASSRLRDEALLRDPTPLFLPTRWNVGENALPANARQEPGAAFSDYAPKLTFPVADLQLGLPTAIGVPKRVPDVFDTDKPKRPYQGFGQTDRSVEALPGRTAFVAVAAVADGGLVLAEPVIGNAPPSESSWQPLEFLIAIDRAGLVRPAMLVTSSQVSSVDAYFRDFLTDGLHIGERLAPGFYRVSIGP